MRRSVLPFSLALFALLLTACGGGGGSASDSTQVHPDGSVSKSGGILCGGASLAKTQTAPPVGIAAKSTVLQSASIAVPLQKTGTAPRAVNGGVCQNAAFGSANGNPFNLTGTIRYEDRAFGRLGFTGVRPTLTVRGATVELTACANPNQVLASTRTDASGLYSFTNVVNTTGSAGVFIRAVSEDTNPNAPIDVHDTRGALYALSSLNAFDENSGGPFTHNLLISEASGVGGAFNLLDTAQRGVDFVTTHLPATVLPRLRIIWEAGVTNQTVYTPSSQEIIVRSQPNANPPDTDEYDDMVVMHEVGHFIGNAVGRETSPGGDHLLGATDQDARLAWSEGWGNFFASAATGRRDYVDTTGGNGLLVSFDIEQREALDPFATPRRIGGGSANEFAVAATLWDGLDTPNSDVDADPANLGASVLLGAMSDLNNLNSAVRFGDFWAKLAARIAPQSQMGSFQTAAAVNLIQLTPDNGADDTPVDATVLATPGTLPRVVNANLAYDPNTASADFDHYRITLTGNQTYAICTFALTDGADTQITLLNSSGTAALTRNDNHDDNRYSLCQRFPFACPANSPTNLASTLTITPAQDTEYLIQVSRSDNDLPSSDQFGGYSLGIAQLATPSSP